MSRQIFANRLSKLSLAILVFSITISPASSYDFKIPEEENQYTSEHFLIYFPSSIPAKYIREFTRRCEQAYYLIKERLGFTGVEETAEKVKIFLAATKYDYQKNSSSRDRQREQTLLSQKVIQTYYFEEDFFAQILPHQLAHILFNEFVGLPLWFSEGLALANEQDSLFKYLLPVKGFKGKGMELAVGKLEQISREEEKFSREFCAQSASLIIFLLEDYHQENFAQLCRNLKNGQSFYVAMGNSYAIQDGQDLEEKFLRFLESKSYEDIVKKKGFCIRW